MAVIIIGKIPGIITVADYEELQKAQQCPIVSIARVIFIIDNLPHSPARADCQGL